MDFADYQQDYSTGNPILKFLIHTRCSLDYVQESNPMHEVKQSTSVADAQRSLIYCSVFFEERLKVG